LPFVLCAAAYGTAVLIGAGEVRDLDITGASAANWALNAALGFGLGTAFILGEEIGWRGYLLPRIQQMTTRRRAAVLTGFAHGLFHLPLILLATTYNTEGARWIVAPAAVVVITAGGVFYAYLYDRSGTVWPAAIAHNMVNTVFDAGSKLIIATSPASLAYVAGETGFATLGIVTAAAIVLLLTAKVWKTAPRASAGAAEEPASLATSGTR
jgi:membrane protease YdiL (CAAX protease family)